MKIKYRDLTLEVQTLTPDTLKIHSKMILFFKKQYRKLIKVNYVWSESGKQKNLFWHSVPYIFTYHERIFMKSFFFIKYLRWKTKPHNNEVIRFLQSLLGVSQWS